MLLRLSCGSCFLIVILLVIFPVPGKSGIVSWLFGSEKQQQQTGTGKGSQHEHMSTALNSKAKFEMKMTDEKFLMEAQKLSPLDACHHVIIAKLKKSCSDMTEEDMGKLSVLLLNCQSESENRKIFTCTPEMSIAECTSEMDPVTWNAYQIVSNRARAMCYSIRQQQFRLKTEFTVNRLVSTTEDQLVAMEKLEEHQTQIQTVHSDTLQKMVNGQQDLMSRQEVLKNTQASISGFISNNLRELYKEKALIAAGHSELAKLTEQIKTKLDKATGQLANQEKEQKINHAELLKDLSEIRDKAKDVWDKIDESTQHVLEYQEETTKHYEDMLENLKKVNQTITFMLSTIEDMRGGILKHLTWLSAMVGGAGDQLSVLTTCVLHIGYFLLAAISATFLGTPRITRLTLLVTVPLNAVAELKHGTSFDFIGMTIFIGLTVAANWCYNLMCSTSSKPETTPSVMPAVCLCSPRPASPPSVTHSSRNASKVTDDTAASDETESIIDNSFDTTTDRNNSFNTRNPLPYMRKIRGLKSPPTPSQSSAVSDYSTTETPVRDSKSLQFDTPSTLAPTPVPETYTSFLAKQDIGKKEMSVDQVRRHLMQTLSTSSTPKRMSPANSRSSTPSRSSRGRSTPKPPCLATTKHGQPCKLGCVDGFDFCYKHQARI